jgi:anthranilate phosphoribosyltransferase
MKETLQFLFEHRTLSKEQAKFALVDLALGKANPAQMAAFMTVFMMRTATVEELEGFKDAMLELCIPIDLAAYNPIDLCGTGGDGKDTFNVSTIASFVVAGAGVKVAKHGNYGVSSAVGSSNILEHFGIKFSNEIDVLKKQIENIGICPYQKRTGGENFFQYVGTIGEPISA